MLEVAVVLLLTVQLARLAWIVAIPPAPVGAPPSLPEPDVETSASATADVFFRSALPVAGDGLLEALGYRLFGVRATESGGSAILGSADGVQGAYSTGDEVAPGIVLEAVGADHAILAANGARHRVDLPEAMPATSNASTSASTATLPSAAPSTPQPAGVVAPVPVDPASLLAQTGLRPLSEAGRVAGYTLIPRNGDGLLRQAGLMPGDVIVSVNGQALTPERVGELEQELQGQPEAVIAFTRDGQPRSITLKAPQP
ncbi:MAG: type II secretion system protein C [Pseudomonadota bacterium]|nr:type II secretion system protein C [Pseudomonadota bacterium]